LTEALFRREVLEAQRSSGLGGIALVQPLAASVLVVAAVAVALVVVLFLCLASYTRRVSVAGQLAPARGLATVVAPARGVAAEVATEEGAQVRAGQRLLRLVMPMATAAGEDAVVALQERLEARQQGLQAQDAARAQIAAQQAAGLRAQLTAARAEQARVDEEIHARQAQLVLAGQSLARLRELERQRYVSAAQVEQQQSSVLEFTSQIQSMRRMAAAGRRSIAQLEQALAELPGQRRSEAAGYQQALAQLGQELLENQARGAQAIKAPVSGRVASLLVKAGQAVEVGQPLLSVLPADERLEAELWVPSRAIGFVAPGDSVLLRYQAFPYQKFGHQQGTVRSVGRSALGQREQQALAVAGAGEPYYRVTVSLRKQGVLAYGRQEMLRPGMLLEADILGERRRLVEWLFEPLYSIQGRVGQVSREGAR